MTSLDHFLPNVTTQDTRKRIQAHQDLVPYLSDPHSSLSCTEIDEFIGGLVAWVNSSNYKISLNGLEVLCFMVNRMGEDFRPYVNSVLPAVIDRLGDSKDQVRDQAQQLLLKLMMPASNPQFVFERIMSAFTHKLWHVREEVLFCLQNTINTYGARSLQLSKIVPSICRLLDDQNSQVRETAINSLAEIYRHVGEKVRQDLAKKGIQPQRLNQIYAKFDEVKNSGNMLATADFAPSRGGAEDETDFARPISTKVPKAKSSSYGSSSVSGTSRKSVLPGKSSSAASTGGVDEDFFIKSFEDVVKVQLFSSRDVQDHMSKIRDTLSDSNIDWEKRAESIKKLRSVIIAGGLEHDEFFQHLRTMEVCFISAVKDLRSQIVREACITAAYMSQQMGSRFDHMAESILPSLINLIPNSAKVMAFSGVVCIRFIIQYTHSSRLIPIITSNMTSKSNIIRRYSCEFLNQLLHNWTTHILEKYIANLQDAIKRGINDADSDARAFSRKAFWGFADHFRDQADALLNSLEPAKQKMLQGELSGSSSNNSLNSAEGYKLNKPRARSASQDRGSGFDSSTLGRIGKKKQSHFSSARSDTGAANSRSGSPASRLSYLTHTTSGRPDPMTPRTQRRSGMVRSQGASREGSPSRVVVPPGRERRLSGGKLTASGSKVRKGSGVISQRTLRPGSDVEDAVADALQKGPLRRRYDPYDSDDAASETSSVCSERSYSSLGRTSENKDRETSSPPVVQHQGQNVKDTTEIILLLGSGSYADRKEGLIALQHLLRSGRYLNRVELQKVTEVFTRMFHDPHSKVLSLFLDTLVDLLTVHSRDLTNQLYMYLTKLLVKTGTDMLGSVQIKVQKALDAVRENFPCDHQFNILTKYIVDHTQSPNLKAKVKAALLNYMHSLALMMDQSDFMNSADTRLAVSRIINWTTEPKTVEVRKGAQLVLIALFNLNPPEFSMMLSILPKPFQDSATKILHSHIQSASHGSEVLSPKNVMSPPQNTQNRSRPPSRGHRDVMETENMNPEDIYNSIKQTSADIQSLSINSKLDNYDDVKKKHEFTSQDSGIQDLRNDSPDAVDNRKGHYNPSHYQDEGTLNGFNRSRLADSEFDEAGLFNEDLSENDLIANILTELSNHNERNTERKDAMLSLIKMTREGTFGLWDEHFKSILLILLETLGDTDGHIRALALRVLREILRNQPHRFKDYAELTTLRILEAHKDPVREVFRSAEECADTLANYIAPEQSVRILNSIINTAQFPISLAAIKMQNKVLELLPKEALETILPEIIPGLLRGYDDKESTVRKAAVFCLVAIYLSVGDVLWMHLTSLNYSKVKLLNLYIKRAQQKSGSGSVKDSASSLDT